MQQTLGPRSIPNYHEGLQVETKQFVRSLLADPKNYIRHIRQYSGGLTLSAVYGYTARSSNDKYFLIAEESMDIIANEIVGGVGLWPVDIFPFLRYIPTWAPGGGFKRKAAVWKNKIHDFMQMPYDEAKQSMVRPKRGLRIVLPLKECSSRQREPSFPPSVALISNKAVITPRSRRTT